MYLFAEGVSTGKHHAFHPATLETYRDATKRRKLEKNLTRRLDLVLNPKPSKRIIHKYCKTYRCVTLL